MYADEAGAAQAAGCDIDLLNFERLVYEQNAAGAVARIPEQETERVAVYRGWMMRPHNYTALYDALLTKNIRLINDPDSYRFCHHLPHNYPLLEGYTPKSVWLPYDNTFSMEKVFDLLAPFGNSPLVLKDYVKSRKHEWDEACFIPSAASHADIERVVSRFLELQGDDLNEGLVFREFVPFRALTTHSKSGMPLTVEFRCVVLDGTIVLTYPYWDEGDYPTLTPPLSHFADIAARIPSRFFTMDIAQRDNGDWMIVEIGDAQVSGLPDNADVEEFYGVVADKVRRT